MPHQKKNIKSHRIEPMILLPVVGSVIGKKTPPNRPGPSTLDFHLEMIKKIDKLLADHEHEEHSPPSFQQPPLIPHQPPNPIEPRSPLSKTFPHEEITWKPVIEPTRTTMHTIPEEFKTELSVTPEFRFITSLEILQEASLLQVPIEERVEIIDINTLTGETTTSHNTMKFFDTKNQEEKTPESTVKIQGLKEEDLQSSKVEVIDTQALQKETKEETWVTANQQAKEIEKKAKVYFLNKKDDADKKQKNQRTEQSYIPDDFEERFKALKEKKKKEAEQKRQGTEQTEEDVETEAQQKEEASEEKDEAEKKEKGLFARREKLQRTEEEKREDSETIHSGNDPSLYKTASELKKELREQKRLHQQAIRKARIEERQRKKAEKEALKTQKKQPSEKEQKPPVESELPEQDRSPDEEEIEEEEEEFNDEEEDRSEALDEDIRKVLLMTDYLLGELPEDVLNIFLESEEFKLYEKVLSKYKIKKSSE